MSEILLIMILFVGVLLALYFMGMPVAIAIGITSVVIMASPLIGNVDTQLIATRLMHSLNSFTMLAVPFYLLLGRLMNRIGMTDRIFRFARSVVGSFKGGIGYVNIVASLVFSGMSGLAIADAAGLGRIEYKAMRDDQFDVRTSLGVTGASAIVGPIFPPSVLVIVYALLADVSIGRLFLAGVAPAILYCGILMAFLFIIIKIKDITTTHPFSLRELVDSFAEGFVGLVIPVFIIGGLISGFFTATEAGGIAVLYTIAAGFWIGELSVPGLIQELEESMVETFAILFIVAMASIYSLVALQIRLPTLLLDTLLFVSDDPTTVLVLVILLMFVIGMFMPAIVSVTVLVPILIPIITPLGIDPIFFGIVMLLTLMLGLLTPPFGMVLFVLDKVTDASLEDIFRAMVPFYIPILITLGLLITFPEIVTYIPENYYG